MTSDPTQFALVVDRGVRSLLHRWAWVLNGVLLIYAGLPWLSPLLRILGFERLGWAIFSLYSVLCHQLPERSFFIARYQVCYCHRCTALYTSLLVMSLLYTAGRWKQSISHRLLLLMILPILIDGGWHMLDEILPFMLRSADNSVGSLNFWLRMVTGALFGIAIVLWAYPRLEREMDHLEL
jgi:uncharacterized membrane protein